MFKREDTNSFSLSLPVIMLSIEGYEYCLLTDAINDARAKYERIKQDVLEGRNTNASLDGCQLILGDFDRLLSKLKALE